MSNNDKHSTSSNNTIKFKVDSSEHSTSSKTYIMREKEWKMLRMWEVEGYKGPKKPN